MKKQCLFCGKEFEAERSTAKFCSDVCKLKFNRGFNGGKDIHLKEEVSVPQCSALTKDELYTRIEFYPQDTWKDSPEFAELMKRLKEMSIEELEAKGYSVPNWKRNENK